MNRALNDWMDKAEGKEEGSSNKNIDKEKERQGYGKIKATKDKKTGKLSMKVKKAELKV